MLTLPLHSQTGPDTSPEPNRPFLEDVANLLYLHITGDDDEGAMQLFTLIVQEVKEGRLSYAEIAGALEARWGVSLVSVPDFIAEAGAADILTAVIKWEPRFSRRGEALALVYEILPPELLKTQFELDGVKRWGHDFNDMARILAAVHERGIREKFTDSFAPGDRPGDQLHRELSGNPLRKALQLYHEGRIDYAELDPADARWEGFSDSVSPLFYFAADHPWSAAGLAVLAIGATFYLPAALLLGASLGLAGIAVYGIHEGLAVRDAAEIAQEKIQGEEAIGHSIGRLVLAIGAAACASLRLVRTSAGGAEATASTIGETAISPVTPPPVPQVAPPIPGQELWASGTLLARPILGSTTPTQEGFWVAGTSASPVSSQGGLQTVATASTRPVPLPTSLPLPSAIPHGTAYSPFPNGFCVTTSEELAEGLAALAARTAPLNFAGTPPSPAIPTIPLPPIPLPEQDKGPLQLPSAFGGIRFGEPQDPDDLLDVPGILNDILEEPPLPVLEDKIGDPSLYSDHRMALIENPFAPEDALSPPSDMRTRLAEEFTAYLATSNIPRDTWQGLTEAIFSRIDPELKNPADIHIAVLGYGKTSGLIEQLLKMGLRVTAIEKMAVELDPFSLMSPGHYSFPEFAVLPEHPNLRVLDIYDVGNEEVIDPFDIVFAITPTTEVINLAALFSNPAGLVVFQTFSVGVYEIDAMRIETLFRNSDPYRRFDLPGPLFETHYARSDRPALIYVVGGRVY